jgi:hypothetical protein
VRESITTRSSHIPANIPSKERPLAVDACGVVPEVPLAPVLASVTAGAVDWPPTLTDSDDDSAAIRLHRSSTLELSARDAK